MVSRARREAAAARRDAAQAEQAALELVEQGELVPIAEVRADVFAKFTGVKTRHRHPGVLEGACAIGCQDQVNGLQR